MGSNKASKIKRDRPTQIRSPAVRGKGGATAGLDGSDGQERSERRRWLGTTEAATAARASGGDKVGSTWVRRWRQLRKPTAGLLA
ncbi:hypothetical protein M0R45_036039 [Rubus argutus]|uniref:Uncharacterized protein n=1 Tax=Rubus argutus TaxID=59490 RepID=A0AAW1VVX7_RUBAR